MEGQGIKYGDQDFPLKEKNFPAIIDTGSSTIGVPDKAFTFIKENWKKAVPDLDCVIDDNFCESKAQCDQVAKNITSISL